MDRERKSPQQKKRESYAKDRRNTYGENSKASRKAIPRRKAIERRALRRIARAAIGEATSHADLDRLDALEPRLKSKRRRGWRKVLDAPLGAVLLQKLAFRARREGRKASRQAGGG
jgi:hypothetical protein